MAKRGRPPKAETIEATPQISETVTEKPIEATIETSEWPGSIGGVVVNIPLAEIADGYCSRHIEVGRLTQSQSKTLRMIRDGLMVNQAQVPSEFCKDAVRPVKSNADVVRWLLDEVARTHDGISG